MNYLAQSDPDTACGNCGRELPTRSHFCDRCGHLRDSADDTIVRLVDLHRAGTITAEEYIAALKIQRGTYQHGVIVVKDPGRTRRWAGTRVANEVTALAAVLVAITGFMVGSLITDRGPLRPERAPADVAMVPVAAPGWEQEDLREPDDVLRALDRFWAETRGGIPPGAPSAVDSDADGAVTGCTLEAPAAWCTVTETVVYSRKALGALGEQGGNGLPAAILARVGAQRAGILAPIVSPLTVECLAGAATAELADGSTGGEGNDPLLALLRSHSHADGPVGDFGVHERAMAGAAGYRDGADACSRFDGVGSDETRLGGGHGSDDLRSIVEAAIIAADEAFIGVEQTKITPDEIVAGGCPLDGGYAAVCDGRLAYDPVRLGRLASTYGRFAPAVPVIMAYTALQQAEAKERGGAESQYCGVGATARQVQKMNDDFGAEISTLVLADLDELALLVIGMSPHGDAAVAALEAVWDGYLNGASACL